MVDLTAVPRQRETMDRPDTLRGHRRRRRAPSRDATAVLVVAVARVAALLGVTAIGSYTAALHGHSAQLLIVLGLIGIPWATVVLFAADRPDNRVALYGGPIGDLLMLFAVEAFLPNATQEVLPGYLAVVAFAGYTVGRAMAGALVTGGLVLVVTERAIAPAHVQLPRSTGIPFAIGLAAVLLLVERTTALQARAAATSDRLRGRADTILTHVADAVFVTDAAGSILLANPATERLLGRAAGDIEGLPCAAALGLHSGERPLDCSRTCPLLADTGDGAGGREVWRYDANGQRQPLLADAAVIGSDGDVEVVHSVRDITRLKQAEEAKTLFLATASHELKTPLTVISGFASTLLRHPDLDPDQRRAALSAIETRAAELSRIVERLLLSSRIDAGRVDLELSPVELVELVRDRAEACGIAMQRTIDFTAEADVPAVVANGPAVTTVVDHLLDNAIKYSPGGEPMEVHIGVEGAGVRLEVRDHGIGMDPDQLEHCFDRFWQAESSDVRRFGGTGIGLYIVQSLVHTMRATIDVDSAIGDGTTFSVGFRPVGAPAVEVDVDDGHRGEATSIREFMRQIGVGVEGSRP